MTSSSDKLFTPAFFGVIGFVAVIHVAWWMFGTDQGMQGAFADGDSYLRLIRIEQLLASWNWFDVTIPDTNAPYGASVHWTRLFDVVILTVAAPIMMFTDTARALFLSGMIISPIIHLLSAAALIWAVKPLLGARSAYFVAAVSAAQAGILAFAIIGRADHHMMFVLLVSLALGFLIRLARSQRERVNANALLLGVTLAFGIWTGPEFLLFSLLVMALQWACWIVGEENAGFINLRVAIGLYGGLVVMVLIERGFSGALIVEYDKLSIVHVTFAAFALLFWIGGSLGTMQSKKLLYSVVTALILGGVMVALYPKIAGNPLNDANPKILPIYAMISEYRAISDFPRFMIYFGSIAFAAPWLGWRIWQNRQGDYRWIWLLLGIEFVLYLTLAINWLRWSLYAALFISICMGDMIACIDERISRKVKFPARVLAKASAIFALSVGTLIIGASLLHAGKTEQERMAEKINSCPVVELAGFLNQSPLGDMPKTIVASANFGAEIIYRTNHKVLATVHHRSVDGILDGYRILNGTDDSAVLKIINKRAIDLLILCPASSNDAYFLLGDDANSLYKRLEAGSLSYWVKPVILPDVVTGNFLVFSIQR